MNARSHQRRTSASVWLPVLVGVLMAVFALYVLSVGPVAKMLDTGFIPPSMLSSIQAIYYPLKILRDNAPAVKSVIDSYMDLWI